MHHHNKLPVHTCPHKIKGRIDAVRLLILRVYKLYQHLFCEREPHFKMKLLLSDKHASQACVSLHALLKMFLGNDRPLYFFT